MGLRLAERIPVALRIAASGVLCLSLCLLSSSGASVRRLPQASSARGRATGHSWTRAEMGTTALASETPATTTAPSLPTTPRREAGTTREASYHSLSASMAPSGTAVDIRDSTTLAAPQTSASGWSMSAWVKPTAAPTSSTSQAVDLGRDRAFGSSWFRNSQRALTPSWRAGNTRAVGQLHGVPSASTNPVGDWTLLTGTWDGTT